MQPRALRRQAAPRSALRSALGTVVAGLICSAAAAQTPKAPATKTEAAPAALPTPQTVSPATAQKLREALLAHRVGQHGEAFMAWLPLANQGNGEALFWLGNLYRRGLGVKQDGAEAMRRYRAATQAGNPDGEAGVGRLHELGIGVKADAKEALRWYQQAVARKSAWGRYYLGLSYLAGDLVKTDHPRGLELLRAAVAQGLEDAELALAKTQKDASFGVEDVAAYLATVKRLAGTAAMPDAMLELGNALLAGIGGPTDLVAARRWITRAADAGDDEAQNQLAWSLAGDPNNTPWPKDLPLAAHYARLAAAQGAPGGQLLLGKLLLNGDDGVVRNPTEARQWLAKAASHPPGQASNDLLADARTTLADLLLTNQGGPIQCEEAQRWYREAFAAGNDFAQLRLDEIQHGACRDRAAWNAAVEHVDTLMKVDMDKATPAQKAQDAELQKRLSALVGQGVAAAQCVLATYQALKGDDPTALPTLVKGATVGQLVCLHSLIFYGGQGVFNEALPPAQVQVWRLRAAERGLALAYNELSWAYQKGDGVPEDLPRAHLFASLYAQRDPASAAQRLHDLGLLLGPGGRQQAEQLMKAWLAKGAQAPKR